MLFTDYSLLRQIGCEERWLHAGRAGFIISLVSGYTVDHIAEAAAVKAGFIGSGMGGTKMVRN
ncbi:hypothetical protein, partial [Porticoccus sp.]|uniref:hypothetical protein n=1 Tax=Porticoccus sp. TaxID=2024853 RepID=UPI003F69E180